MWLSKCITDTGPHLWYVDRSADRVVAWSPPRVKIRGVLETLVLEASRPDTTLWQSEIRPSLGAGDGD